MIKSCLQTLCSSFNSYVKYVCSVRVLAVCTFVSPATDFAKCPSVWKLVVVYLQLLDDVNTAVWNSVCFELSQKDKALFGCLEKERIQSSHLY